MKKIGIIGLWHLGCVLSAAWAKLGHSVAGYDPDGSVVESLNNAEPPLFEPGLSDAIQDAINKSLLSFSSNVQSLGDCDFVFLSYDTPVLDDDSSDTSILEKAIKDVSGVMKDGSVLIMSSQSPVGFCSEMRELLRQVNDTLDLVYSPENLRLGEAIECYLNPGRIILGTANEETAVKCEELFGEITGEVLSMDLESSEMVKHGINSFLSASIVFANHLADLCEASGARIDDVVRGMKSDPRIGEQAYLSAGIGFSGGTLGRDLKVLESKNKKVDGGAFIFEKVHRWNASRKDIIVKRIETILGNLDGSRILIAGATYKPGTSTLRRSLPLEIAGLLSEGGASISVYDPKADFAGYDGEAVFEVAADIDGGATGADMILLLTNWPEFKDYDWVTTAGRMRRKIFFDARNYLDEQAMSDAGYNYYSIGRS